MKRSLFLGLSLLVILLVACGTPPAGPEGGPPVGETQAEPPPTRAAEADVPPTQPPAAVEESAPEPTVPPAVVEEPEPTEPPAAESAEPMADVDWTAAWLVNTAETSAVFGSSVGIQSVTVETINGVDYQCITSTGLPSYQTEATQTLIDGLNGRPKAAEEFATGGTTVTLGDVISFGSDIGFTPRQGCTSPSAGYGYWPPGPVCPEVQAKTQCFPMDPEPTVDACETGLGSIGTWINGVSIYNWGDGQSYNNQRVWTNTAPNFEIYDLDICVGHAANGDYHHHGAPICLIDQLGEAGDGHSEIYGFAADGYPIYGPYHAAGVLAESCWIPRDYDDPNSATGCGVAGERSCLLVDQTDISKGTIPASSNGPRTDEVVSSMSGNTFVATSGYYFEDYYYDAACAAQGGPSLDQYNGHDHDGLGYHYHVTAERTDTGGYADVFPYYIGPEFAGLLQPEGIVSCGGGAMPGGGEGGPPGGDEGGPPEGGEGQQGGAPDLSPVAEALGVSVEDLEAALGDPPPDFEAAAAALGVSAQALQDAMSAAGLGGPP